MSTKSKPSDRVNLRVAPALKSNLLKAAKASGRSLTDFVLDAAVATADDVLASRTTFVLSPKDWRKFNDLLDAPPRDIPRLRRLFKEKSILEQ